MTEEFFKKAKELMTDKEALEKVRYKQENRWNGWDYHCFHKIYSFLTKSKQATSTF